jgi:hypothetical protein
MNSLIKSALFLLVACGGPGGLTVEQLTTAKEGVHPLQPKADAKAALIHALGEPSEDSDEATVWKSSGPEAKCLNVKWMGAVLGSSDIKGC